MKFSGKVDFEHGKPARTGVLVCNLGTPDEPTPAAVRRYLAEFLRDPRVVELPRALWLPVLYGIILNTRPRRSAAAYAAIWREDGSPLLTLSEKLTRSLALACATGDGASPVFELAMRYGRPSIAAGIDRLLDTGARRILVLPLYPQYAAATTASVFDTVFAHCRTLRWIPEVRTVADYHTEPAYIEALARSVESHWQTHGRGERLLLSFHGIPRDCFLAGDPYHCQCQATAHLLRERLELDTGSAPVAFQSRFGPRQWLEPYSDETLKAWAANGIRNVDVVCPGFAVDCLETLEEIAIRYAETFRAAGGETLRYIPALNDQPAHVAALLAVLERHLHGWAGCGDADDDLRAAAAARARAAGAPR